MNVKTRLVMSFKTDDDKVVSLSLDNPREDVTEDEIKTAMESVVAADIFEYKKAAIVSAVEAKIVKTDTTEYDLVIE